jgi:Domain of unknown function (DUF2017)
MEGFRATREGGASARFGTAEAYLIRGLVDQISAMLGGDEADPADSPQAERGEDDGLLGLEDLEGLLGRGDRLTPDDPVLARLLPDAYRDDPEAAEEFRKYTESGLRSAKRAAARTVLSTLPADGGRVKLSEDEAQDWLRSLNDVRLALGVRLGVTEEFEEEWRALDPADPRAAVLEVYAWLGAVQDSLLHALM